MNPLTLVKRIQNINSKEADLGISEEASWHAKYRDSAYVFVGGIPYDLTEGDLLAVFAQYGEVVDINLVRDKATGKSKGFAFLAYEDQRSTTLAVDNLNGAQVLGRIVRVDHCGKYVKREEEDEETQQKKREERGVCRAFQRGECTRGASCKFSHDEKRAANTGWGVKEDKDSSWEHDKFEGRRRDVKQYGGQENVRSADKGKEKRFHRRDEDEVTEIKSKGYRDERQERRGTRYVDYEPGRNSRDGSDRTKEQSLLRYNEQERVPRSSDDRDNKDHKRSKSFDDKLDKKQRSEYEFSGREEKRSRYDEGGYEYKRDVKISRADGSVEHEPRSRRDRDNKDVKYEEGSRSKQKTTQRRDQDERTHDRERDGRRRERDR